ncbi:Tryptophan synthase alpha chain [Labilithrix luteola]|uniref:Tryptophan synthase alpha chain n=1 Tax=Labilithrix luteola TaxID=1391654 RepID=A0A0K1PQD6_9BACT|nr:Tryptophan synthase alpha chain [Labilithrix luteola]
MGLVAASCAEANSLGDGRDAGPSIVGFTPPDGGDGGDPFDAGETTLMCASNKCMGTFTTCPGSAFLCDTDLANDLNNCGRCGFTCSTNDPYNVVKFTCSEGKCVSAGCGLNPLGLQLADCDGFLDNGCEVTLGESPDNCGACGDKCAQGENCIFDYSTYTGHCGCAPPLLDCSNGARCTDPRNDDANCGACGNVCRPPAGKTAPPKSHFGCSKSECGHLKCDEAAPFYRFADCNKDLESGPTSDGCEVDILAPNDDHCGACNNKCKDGQHCFFDRMSGPICECPTGQRFCEERGTCIDTSSDPKNCGGCNVVCPGPTNPAVQHGGPTCRSGQCGIECEEGFADCNGDINDGCEVELRVDPKNCGGCGVICDGVALQPCVGGKCAVEPCGGPR